MNKTQGLTDDSVHLYRPRVQHYGKWYLPPDSFNRRFDALKNVVTSDELDARQVERITEIKQQAKKEQKLAIREAERRKMNNTHLSGFGASSKDSVSSQHGDGVNLKQAPIFDAAKKIVFEQEKEILTTLQNIATQLSPTPAHKKLKRRKTIIYK